MKFLILYVLFFVGILFSQMASIQSWVNCSLSDCYYKITEISSNLLYQVEVYSPEDNINMGRVYEIMYSIDSLSSDFKKEGFQYVLLLFVISSKKKIEYLNIFFTKDSIEDLDIKISKFKYEIHEECHQSYGSNHILNLNNIIYKGCLYKIVISIQ